ncbi:MAG: chloride channel protein [Eubacterium sp.]|nr:chloride channel protein [Eubacterium sp.]MCM1216944.1 chloride channel protein [Lachnospiraceae bacterium]MCM1303985.1 chloride channel protein [Butyrivibrio sp.]MCM1344827.1 chloride channel protein [Muribaculaceae bacterium]MCM1240651.1 chloride channel protein [Lachnospiraceae bacterium]
MLNNEQKKIIRHNLHRMISAVKWVVFSIISGVLIGFVGTLFYKAMAFVTGTRLEHPWMICLLPIGGLAIVGSYHLLRDQNDTGTNLVISAIHSGDHLPVRMAPLIFLSTLITHLFGGSAGREGAALQLGGSIGSGIGSLLRLDEKDKHVMIMCGMSAAFSALFGTPLAAAIFSMEVVSVGIMYYSALVPCAIASLTAHGIAAMAGVAPETFAIAQIPDLTVISAVRISVLAILCALVSILFCVAMHGAEHLYRKYLKNPFLRVFVGGCIVVLLTALAGDQTYNGAGMDFIAHCMEEATVRPEAFLIKILFTAATLCAGFKGGEIVPSFFAGAAFGCLFGNLTGFSPTLCTAVGMIAVFCGVTNCPITSLLISFELFGYAGTPYFLLSVAFSYMLSGYFGLYHSQKIVYSKFKTNYINRKTS